MIKRLFFTLLSFSFFTLCYSQNKDQFYFPLEVFKDSSAFVGHDTFVVTWYSKHLSAMNEPIIYSDKSEREIYRFIWLRTFHNPIAIRIEKTDNSYFLYWKLCDGAGGYEPGNLVVNEQQKIDKLIWDTFIAKLNQIDFWNLPTSIKSFGLDGSEWILEGKTSNNYHVVDRWMPNENSKFYSCCDFLIGLTDLIIKKKDKY